MKMSVFLLTLFAAFIFTGCNSSRVSNQPASDGVICTADTESAVIPPSVEEAPNTSPPIGKVHPALHTKGEVLSGGRDLARIQQVIFVNIPALRYVYNRRLREQPDLSGDIIVQVAVNELGEVTSVQVTESTMGDPEFDKIAAERIISKWNFGKIDVPDDVTVFTYPFTFMLDTRARDTTVTGMVGRKGVARMVPLDTCAEYLYRTGKIDAIITGVGGLRSDGDSVVGRRMEIKMTSPDFLKGGQLTGGRSRAVVQRAVIRNASQLRQIYNERLRENPELTGRILVKFAVNESGEVISAQLVESEVGDPEFEQAVVENLKTWDFGAINKPGDVTEVTYPFVFTP